eukprot:7956398-Pyramimonas_sp.AAC.1
MAAEPKVGEKWEAFVADRLPQKPDDAIEGNRCAFCDAAQKTSPEELLELTPPPFPMSHQVQGRALIARCPVKARERAGRKSSSTRSWCSLAPRVSNGDAEDLRVV